MAERIFITTPIYYVNDEPHLGHAYTTVAADVVARYYQQQGKEVFFSVGVDENSQKTVLAAQKSGLDIGDYTDQMAEQWQQAWKELGIDADVFIRTTSPDHHAAVKEFLSRVKKEDIYLGRYEGLYCVGHEAFMTENDLVDGKCPEHGTAPERIAEDNYFFRLSGYRDALLQYYDQHPEFIQPESRRNEVVEFVRRELKDISITRQTRAWGIPFPQDPSHVIYVWFDALINYLTVIGYGKDDTRFHQWWPATLQLVGKDIIRFHCILWPAMLLSAGLSLPQRVFAHGFFTMNGKKMSKTLGNVIHPRDLVQRFGVDGARYLLLSQFPFGEDGDISEKHLTEKYNADLANGIGNLASRVLAMAVKFSGGEMPVYDEQNLVLIKDARAARDTVHQEIEALALDRALKSIWGLIGKADEYVDTHKPWALAKNDPEKLKLVLADLLLVLQELTWLLAPWLPTTSAALAGALGLGSLEKRPGTETHLPSGRSFAPLSPLFPRHEQ